MESRLDIGYFAYVVRRLQFNRHLIIGFIGTVKCIRHLEIKLIIGNLFRMRAVYPKVILK